jgi:zinc and cadmium transporter
MTYINAAILFLTALFGGTAFLFFPGLQRVNFRNILMFAGSYLFSITIIHILPEVYLNYPEPAIIGVIVLSGFFFQFILEFFSQGIEHGHSLIDTGESHHDHIHAPRILSLMAGLGIHSFLEGMIVAHPPNLNFHHHAGGILLGIVLHKMPETFALMAVMYHSKMAKWKSISGMVLFCLTSPAGLFLSQFINQGVGNMNHFVPILYAFVSGTFLFISTTIFFETSPHHQFNLKKLTSGLAGAFLAVIIQLFL